MYQKCWKKPLNRQLTNIQCEVQSCFQVGYGFVTAALQFPNEITSALDCKRYCATIFIDPSKAFDSIDHSQCRATPLSAPLRVYPRARSSAPHYFLSTNDIGCSAGDSSIHLYADGTVLDAHRSLPRCSTYITSD